MDKLKKFGWIIHEYGLFMDIMDITDNTNYYG